MRKLWIVLGFFYVLIAQGAVAATLISKATGNFTAAGTWYTADATSENDSEAASTACTTSPQPSTAFTPGAIHTSGIAVKVASRVASPTGTFTAELYNSSGSSSVFSTTINVSDMNAAGAAGAGWYLFPVTDTLLITATNYTIRISCSVNAEVTLYSSATTNWAREVRTVTTAAPASGNVLIIAGEHTGAGTGNSFTITMDNTATTSFGSLTPPDGISVNKRATLTYGVAASTPYYFKFKGRFAVYGGGVLNIGSSGAAPPTTSSDVFECDSSTTNVDSGIRVFGGGTWNFYGATLTTLTTLLTADVAAAATSLTVGATTGWAVNDMLSIGTTTQTSSQCEARPIKTVNSGTAVTLGVNADCSSSLTPYFCCTGSGAGTCGTGLTNAHSGTSPTQGEVANLNRNVKIRGVDSTHQGYILIDPTATVTGDYPEIYWMGSATTDKQGITVKTTTGSTSITHASVHDLRVSGAIALNLTGVAINNITFSYNTVYNINGTGVSVTATTGTNIVLDSNLVMLIDGSVSNGFFVFDVGNTITNNTVVGATGRGFYLNEAAEIKTFSGNTAHSNSFYGFDLLNVINSTLTSSTAWRNASHGFLLETSLHGLTFSTITAFGNPTNIGFFNSSSANILFSNVTVNGDTTFASTYGLLFQGASFMFSDIVVESSDFGTTGGIKVGNTQDLDVVSANIYLTLTLRNTKLNSSTVLTGQGNMAPGSYIKAQRLGLAGASGVGVHRAWYPSGTTSTATCGILPCNNGQVDIDSATFKTASPSVKCTPNNASVKTICDCKDIAVASGNTVTPTVYVNKSASYNGNQPRLILLRNVPLGVTTDTVLATASGGTGSWLTLSGATPAASGDDGIFRVCVDIDGTNPAYFDDWSVP